MRPFLLLLLLAACAEDGPGPDEGEREGEGEGEGEGGPPFFADPLRIACRSAACFDGVAFCADGVARVVVDDREFPGFYEREDDVINVDYDDLRDVFVANGAGYTRERDGAEFVNELVDPAVCEGL